ELFVPIPDPESTWNATYGEAFADLKQRNKRKKSGLPPLFLPEDPPFNQNVDIGNGDGRAGFEASVGGFDHAANFQSFQDGTFSFEIDASGSEHLDSENE
ncbi:MAG: hypothetical protein M1829_006485, partial [Trizodia sp. TS-e1964]